jgi:hypothetical protein
VRQRQPRDPDRGDQDGQRDADLEEPGESELDAGAAGTLDDDPDGDAVQHRQVAG